jgi:hypothetical protein
LYYELNKLIVRIDKFDRLFPGHGPVKVGTILLVSIKEACEAVIHDPKCYDVRCGLIRNGEMVTQFSKMIYESGYFKYNRFSLYMNKDELDPES